jgi:hypothetical protein
MLEMQNGGKVNVKEMATRLKKQARLQVVMDQGFQGYSIVLQDVVPRQLKILTPWLQ